jgi:hypothetical protein
MLLGQASVVKQLAVPVCFAKESAQGAGTGVQAKLLAVTTT